MSEQVNENTDPLTDPNWTPPEDTTPSQPHTAEGGEAQPAPGLVMPAEDGPVQSAVNPTYAPARDSRETKQHEVRVPSPTYVKKYHTLVVPQVHGVDYKIGDDVVRGAQVLSENTTVTASPRENFRFREGSEESWNYEV